MSIYLFSILNFILKLVDLGDNGFNDPWSDNKPNKKSSNGLSMNQQEDTDSDDFFPPLASLKPAGNAKPAPPVDPWAVLGNEFSNSPATGFQQAKQQEATNPWQSNTAAPNADPWALNSSPAALQASNPAPSRIDDFDLFTTVRATNQSPVTAAAPTSNNSDPFGDFFGTSTTTGANTSNNVSKNSTNPWNSNEQPRAESSFGILSPGDNKKSNVPFAQAAAQRKTPESFLGENSSLVNLENLIPARPKSTNPFGGNQAVFSSSQQPITGAMSTSNSSGQLNNPFVAQQLLMNQKNPTIGQLQSQQQQQQQQSIFPSFPASMSFGQAGGATFGQLAQPLLPPSIGQPSLPPMSFNQQAMLSPTPPPLPMQPMSNFNAFNQSNQTNNPFLMM